MPAYLVVRLKLKQHSSLNCITQILVSSEWHFLFFNSGFGYYLEVYCVCYMYLALGSCYETVMDKIECCKEEHNK